MRKTISDPAERLRVDNLRKEIKHMMIDLGLDRVGSYAVIIARLSERTGRPIHFNSFVMAMTGYRPYRQLLEDTKALLLDWPKDDAA